MSIKMSDISKVLGLPQATKKPSTLKKLRDPPAPRYIDKQRAIAIARQLKLEKIGKVSLRVSDRSGLSEIHQTSEKALSRRNIIDQTKGLQTASVTKDSAVGKCILGPNKYHNRRLANKMDKILEDQEKKKSMLNRKTREFKHQRRKATSDTNDANKSHELKQSGSSDMKLPSINASDDPINGRRSKSPGYMRPRSCNGTRYTETSVAEAEKFLNSNVIRATLDAPDNKSTVRAIDLVEASNTEYRPMSASQIADGDFESKEQGGEDQRTDDAISNQSPSKKKPFKPLTPPASTFATAGITLLQNKYAQDKSSTADEKLSDIDLSTGNETRTLSPDKTFESGVEVIGMRGQTFSNELPRADVSVPNETSALGVDQGIDKQNREEWNSSENIQNTDEPQIVPKLEDNFAAIDTTEISTTFITSMESEDENDIDINTVPNSDPTNIQKGSESSSSPRKGKIRLSEIKQPLGLIMTLIIVQRKDGRPKGVV
ncbi:uncharacterized protein [Amphiura filiformis]|uniref:uncharacterized protein n=1 Tax=Amphiura filiformis TaxID=82378 RepID=UPI003B22460E